MNQIQLAKFHKAIPFFPTLIGKSLAASSGIFLNPEYHFDLVRPGVALYGCNPIPAQPNPMRSVVSFSAPILQIREVKAGESVGYGASYRVESPRRIATLALGYADGFSRSLSNCGYAFLAGYKLPLVGRVSMDLITIDVSSVPESLIHPQARVEFLTPDYTIDDLAHQARTIAYEILTNLGRRYHRLYQSEL